MSSPNSAQSTHTKAQKYKYIEATFDVTHPLGFSLLGLGWAFVFTPMMATLMRSFTRRRSLALSLGSSGAGIACFVSTPLFQLLVDTYTWRGSLLILGGVSLNLVACGALIRPHGGSTAVAQVGQIARLNWRWFISVIKLLSLTK